jgi:prepilin-type N-terminal cleavage/methylation domain-containing protein
MKSTQAGYSLAEMLTVVAVVGILSLVTVPAFMNFRTSNKVKSSVRTFTTELRRTRQLAITNGRETKLSFATGTSGVARSYNLFLGDTAVGTPATWTALTTPTSAGSGANGYTRWLDDIVYFPANTAGTPQTFTDVDGDGALDVIFFPDGRVQTPAGITTPTITLKTDRTGVSQQVFQVDVFPSGAVKVH